MIIAYLALLTMALLPIYIGSHKSLNKPVEVESLTSKDAYMFPVIGSCVLFGLYLLFKFLSKEYINLLMSVYFTVIGISSLTAALHPVLKSFLPKSIIDAKAIALRIPGIPKIKPESSTINIQMVDVVGGAIATIAGIWYITTKHWIANNLFGESFSLLGIELISLGSFKTGVILLSGLFFYDIFWVFGTEVMVTVAKSFDAPIKVIFPRDIFAEGPLQFSMLGLGDIVIPGIFVALMLRFDVEMHKKKNRSGPLKKTYFRACFTGYITGLVLTIAVMHVFKAAQPALLYLVPCCIGSVVLTALSRGELSDLWSYHEEESHTKEEEVPATAATNTNNTSTAAAAAASSSTSSSHKKRE